METSQIMQTSPDREIVTIRDFGFPRQLVFKAWTDPNHLKNWWGPRGFTNTFHKFDLRPGGTWSFIMHGPDKGNYINECVFIKIEEPRLVAWYRVSKPLFQVEATFDEITETVTRVTFKMKFETPEECEKIRKFVPDKNEENMDGLEAELARMR